MCYIEIEKTKLLLSGAIHEPAQLDANLLAATYAALFRVTAFARPRRFSRAAWAASQAGLSFRSCVCPFAVRAQRRCRRSAPTVSIARPLLRISARVRV